MVKNAKESLTLYPWQIAQAARCCCIALWSIEATAECFLYGGFYEPLGKIGAWKIILYSTFPFFSCIYSFPLNLLNANYSSLHSCCGAGTAADTEKTTELLSSNLTIFSQTSGRNPRLVMAVNILQDMLYRLVFHTHTHILVFRDVWMTRGVHQSLYVSISVLLRYHGQIGASLILGGVDCTGNHLYTVGPYGSVNKVPYLAMGKWHNSIQQVLAALSLCHLFLGFLAGGDLLMLFLGC